MPAVDDSSRTLGRLEASVEELVRQTRALFGKGDETSAQINSLAATVEALAETVAELKTEVKGLRALRDRGHGFVAALALVAGVVGAVASKLLAAFTAH